MLLIATYCILGYYIMADQSITKRQLCSIFYSELVCQARHPLVRRLKSSLRVWVCFLKLQK
jgi:hypothetical protein